MLQEIEVQAAGVAMQAATSTPVNSPQEDSQHAITQGEFKHEKQLHPIPQGKKKRATIDAQLATFEEYRRIYTAVLDFHRTHCRLQTTDDFAALAKDFGCVLEEFGRNRFTRRLLEAVYCEIMGSYAATHPHCGALPRTPQETAGNAPRIARSTSDG